MTICLAIIRITIALAIFPASAIAGANVWYNTPAGQGDCGEECYTPPIAWIDTKDGKHSFGISCGDAMIVGGAAMMQRQPPFSAAEMVIDGRSFGTFSVDNGMNDTYLSATDPAEQSPSRVQDAISSGNALRFRIADSAPLDFTLSGSRAAIQTMSRLCRN